ncbi:MAG: GGDEF domain-containing phosphodiesterase [Acholeplasmatales bacterium]|nr:GGDEF domain-containing phosphodiesterase [Acholeplasmatales bacterium]
MFDFNNFIDSLNNIIAIDEIKQSLINIKDYFHIGKIEIKAKDNTDYHLFILNEKCETEAFVNLTANGYNYEYYRCDDYKFDDNMVKDINLLLKIISISHLNVILECKAKEASLVNSFSKLPNSSGFVKKVTELSKIIDISQYNSYFINIKGFGLVNKLFGSKEADNAILSYASKLKDFEGPNEVVGHLGGDNFVAFIKRERHTKFIDLVTMCPVVMNNGSINKIVNLIGVVGYYEIDSNNGNVEIMSKPGMALQYARRSKKIVVKLTKELENMIESVKNIESTFKDELKNGNFVVYYQPKFDIKSGKIIGVEALSRWINNGNIVPPGVFVPILENNGEIVDLDLYVLENLCKDIHNYRNMGHNIVPASCNLSRRDFEIPDIEQKIISIIRKYNVKNRDIVIEVTETTNLEEKERLAKFINIMNQNGIMTSIDDFGTGYSSLSVLRDFKVSEIKIDRSFINREILLNSDEIIIGSIIDMAKRLSIDVICEGVETEEQARFLFRLGCNNAQGYLYSKPLPKLEFEAMLQKIGTIWD